ncbi:MAG: Tfp pilus assembly protein FimT [Moraxellaceae bacterium]|jgi:type IV fimbrial biogenesis protein FimT|nr:Tfp pilus assembly protein FimT [Moraxellaceae bacterium]
MRQGKAAERGFTMVELLLALSITMLVSTWAVASLHEWWQGLRITAAGNHFIGMLESLRHQSFSMQGALTICGTPDGQRCDKDLGRRLVAFRDSDRDGVVDAGEIVLVQEEFLDSADYWLVWRSFQNKDFLRWASGRTDSMNGTFTLCNRQRKDKWLRQMVVNRAGRTRSVVPARLGEAALQAARKSCGW